MQSLAAQQEAAIKYARKNLVKLCAEMLEMVDTGVLPPNGTMKELRQLTRFAGSAAFPVAESIVRREAFAFIVRQAPQESS